jgi:hypothetical protein
VRENPSFRSGRLSLDYDHVETRGVLAGAYRARKFDQSEEFLTHLVFVDERGSSLRTGCRQPVDNMADIYSASMEESGEKPKCPTCAKKWEKIPPELRGRSLESELPLDRPTRLHLSEWLDHARGERGSEERKEAVEKISRALEDDRGLIERNLTWDEIERMGARLAPNAGRIYQLRSKPSQRTDGTWSPGTVLSTFTTLERALAVGRGRLHTHPWGLIVRGPGGKVWEVTDDDREQAENPPSRERAMFRELRRAAGRVTPWKPHARKAYIVDLAHEAGVEVSEAEPMLRALHRAVPGGILSRIDLVASADPQKLRRSTIEEGRFGGVQLVDIEALKNASYPTALTPNGGYYVWIVQKDGTPLLEGPYGPHELGDAKSFARIGATNGAHNRVVTRSKHPEHEGFRPVVEYEAGTGKKTEF